MTDFVRMLVHFALFYTCIEGLVVNIMYPAVLPYLYKDLVVLVAYLAVFGANPNRIFGPPASMRKFYIPLALFVFATTFYLVVPYDNLLVSAIALKQRIFYLPMAILGYMFVRRDRDLLNCVTLLAVYTIGTALFGVYLFFTGPSGLSAIGANYSAVIMAAETSEAYWRVPGTFTSPGQYGAFMLFNGSLAGGMLLSEGLTRRQRVICGISLALAIVAMFVSGSRSPFVLLTATFAIMLLLTGRLGRIGAWSVTAYAVAAYAFVVLGAGVQGRYGSIVTQQHLERFRTTYFGQLFLPDLLANPLGEGLGAVTVGTRHFREGAPVRFVETYLGMLAIETGWFGLIPFVWAAAAIVIVVARIWRDMKASPLKHLWNAMAIFVVMTMLTLPVSTGIDVPPTNIYFWFSLGAIVKLVDLERYRQWTLRTRRAQPPAPARMPAAAMAPARPAAMAHPTPAAMRR